MSDMFLSANHKLLTSPMRKLRLLEGLTQQQLGIRIKRSQGWVSRLETGDISASTTLRTKIAQILGAPNAFLFPEDED